MNVIHSLMNPLRGRGGMAAVALVLLGVTMTGCLSAKKTKDVKATPLVIQRGDSRNTTTLFDLQSRVMAFSDAFLIGLRQPIDMLDDELDAKGIRNLLQWKASHSQVSIILATGPNPVVNMLDMAGMVTLARMKMEEYWIPKVYGEKGQILLDYHLAYEKEMWDIVKDVLDEEQQGQLRDLIRNWRDLHPNQRFASFVSISDYAKERWQSPILSKTTSRSLLRLIHLDPLSNLDPTTRQIAQTRYTVERTIFYMQRMPALLKVQTELLFMDMMAMPQLERLLDGIEEFDVTADEMVVTVRELPANLAREQEKVIESLTNKEKEISAMLEEFRGALDSGTEMARAVEKATAQLDTFISNTKPKPRPDGIPSRPFDIREYAQVAASISSAATNLNATIQSLNGVLGSPVWQERQGGLTSLVSSVEESSDRVTGRVFTGIIALIGIFLVGLLVTLLIYRKLVLRMS